jgi:hypothetical protein
MNPVDLLKPILEGGIRSTNFFNGRVLSGEDMNVEKDAVREVDRLLGQAIGDGVAYGLEVSKTAGSGTSPLVTVEPGLAINRNGQLLRLVTRVDLSLLKAASSVAGTQSDFSPCTPVQSSVYVANPGVYLLTVSPAEGTEGRAPVSGLQNVAAPCNTKYLIDGVKFRLIQLPLTPTELNDENRLRNLVAYKCFGVEELKTIIADPFGPAKTSYGLLDRLRPEPLTDCDVPLAVLHWTASGGIRWVDMWSVRRGLSQGPVSGPGALAFRERQRAETEAIFLQFEDQTNSLRQTRPNPDRLRAVDQFRYLPPVGIIPLATNVYSKGFHPDLFLDTLTTHPQVFIEGARVQSLLRMGLKYPPVDLEASERPVMLWVYRVRQNRDTLISGTTTAAMQPYLILSTGHMIGFGDPHFDVNRWDFGNYA